MAEGDASRREVGPAGDRSAAVASGLEGLRPRADARHNPPLSPVRVELQDGHGRIHAGQIRNISASGAALRFSRSHLAAGAGLATTLRLCAPTGREVLDLPVEVRWFEQAEDGCFVGVRFAVCQAGSSFLQTLLTG